MGILASIVVEYGSGADSSALVVVELDDAVNIGADGKPKTSFSPGDEPGFLVHFDHDLLRIGQVRSSSGMIVDQGTVTRTRSKQLQFVSTAPVNLQYIPSGPLLYTWYGNNPAPTVDVRRLTPTTSVPAIGEVSHNISARAYKLIPPVLNLAADETWPVLVVITMEAV